jgi:hypothetical protein
MTWAFLLSQLSICPFPIVPERSGISEIQGQEALNRRLEALNNRLEECSLHWPFVEWTMRDIQSDDNLAGIVDRCADERFLLARIEKEARDAFFAGDVKYGAGQQVLLFLELEAVLVDVIKGVREEAVEGARDEPLLCLSCQQEATRKLIVGLFGGEDPLFLRGSLLRCLMIVRMLRTDLKNPLFDHLDEIGSPVTDAMVRSFRNLREWFDFKPEGIFDV